MGVTLGDAILWLRAEDKPLQDDLKSAESKTKSWVGGLGGMLKTGLASGLGFAIGGAINAGIGAKEMFNRAATQAF